ncbi:unnamed protein product [Trichobilharzia regenti]|nr:unnamed protein product [Trichobilharzia regenti]
MSGIKREHIDLEDYSDVFKKRKLSDEGQIYISKLNSDIISCEYLLAHGYSQPSCRHFTAVNIPTSESRVVTIHETYNIGYLDSSDGEEDERLYIFEFADGLEITYPLSVLKTETFFDGEPTAFLKQEYYDQLSSIANDTLNKITHEINDWLMACQECEGKLMLRRHMTAHRACSELRYQTLRLLNILEPHFQYTKFDFQSPCVDKLFYFILKSLDLGQKVRNPSEFNSTRGKTPVVSLCLDPEHCLNNLRELVLNLLQKLMPRLVLPKDFNAENDLLPLIEAVCACNLQT